MKAMVSLILYGTSMGMIMNENPGASMPDEPTGQNEHVPDLETGRELKALSVWSLSWAF
jgi:hypothetical protein